MSCCICSDRQISAVAMYAARRCFVRSPHAPDWAGDITHAKCIARRLAWRNIEAFVAVYESRHRPLPCFDWDSAVETREFDPLALLKCAISIRYQLSDVPDFDTSEDRDLLDGLIRAIACDLPGFDKSEGWLAL